MKSSNNESTTRNNNNNKNGNQNRNNTNGRPNNNQNRPNNNRNQNNNRNGNRPNQPKRDEKQDRIRASVAEAARMAAQANREIANEKPQANHQRTNSAKPGEQRREGRNNQNRPNNNNRNGNNVNRTNNNNRPNNNNRNNENRPSRPNNTNQTTNNRPTNNTTRPAAPAATTANNSGEKKQDRFSGRNNNSRGGNRFGNNQNRPFNKENRKNKKRNRKAKRDGRMKETTNKVVTVRKERPLPDVLEYSEGINVAEIAKKIHREPAEIIKKLFMMGVMVNQNQSLDNDTVELLAADYGIEAQQKVEVDISDIDKILKTKKRIQLTLYHALQLLLSWDTLTMVRQPYLINFVIVISLKVKLVVLLKESVLTNLSMMIS